MIEIVVTLVAVFYTFFIPKYEVNKLDELTNRIHLYLSHLRNQALIDEKYDDKKYWFKKRWTLKFFNCNKNVGGIYFSIYSDESMTGKPKAIESMKDPLSGKYIYSTHFCKENSRNSKYVLLTKNYDIQKIDVSCNQTSTIGQISFGNDGRVYAKLSEDKKYEITKPCDITFFTKDNKSRTLRIHNETGYVEVKK